MKILFVTPAPRAGSQQYTHQLANALVDRGHQVFVATAVDFEMKPYPRRYEVLEVFDGFVPRLLRLSRLIGLVRVLRPDIVHYVGAQHPSAYLVLCHVIRLFSTARFIFSPQDVFPNTRHSIDRRSLPRLYRQMHHVFLNAEQNRGAVVSVFGANPEQITVVPIPDHLAFIRDSIVPCYPDLAVDRRLVLCFGLIEKRKGIPTLLTSFPKVLAEIPNAVLVIAGRPLMDLALIETTISDLRLTEAVALIPRYLSFEEMAGYFSRAELLVLPYDSGWNSGVLASAFGHGKPVVATRVGGFEEVIEDGINGLLVPPRDPDALASAIIRTLSDRVYREKVSAELHRLANAHSWEQLAVTSESVYESVL